MPKRILFLNDLGFQYGAGIAAARQVASLLLAGHHVAAIAWEPGSIPDEIVFTRPGMTEGWGGMRSLRHLETGGGLGENDIIEGILCEAARFRPDVIIIGNLHSARWPLKLVAAMCHLKAEVITYLHDCHLFTGRCAYPGDCNLYLTGCDETCATALEYPPLAPEHIRPAWLLRRRLFSGPEGGKVVTNSRWSKEIFLSAIPDANFCETVYLGADETIFVPGDRRKAREELGLPMDKPLLLFAAVNFHEQRKGGPYIEKLIKLLDGQAYFAGFGHNPQAIRGMIPLPYRNHPLEIAKIYQAADLFVSTSTEESFGQTILEAQLCGCPVAAFNVGGIPEIVHNEITGRLVPKGNVEELAEAVTLLLQDPATLNRMGLWSRYGAEQRFSLQAQADGWTRFFNEDNPRGTGLGTPDTFYPRKPGEDGTYRPSWSIVTDYVNEEHKVIFDRTSLLPGWQMTGDTLKLYEMGYFAGDTILEIGTYGGRSATVELRGALANPKRTQSPRFYGVDIDPGSIARTRQTLVTEKLDQYCQLYLGNLDGFIQRWKINPTMVFVDGDHKYEGVAADIRLLASLLSRGTPVLFHDYLNPENNDGSYGVRQAVDEWVQSGQVRFAGSSGCSALIVVN